MSLSLRCPNCGAVIDTISNCDNYKGIDENTVCKNCQTYKFHSVDTNTYVYTFITIIVLITLAINLA